MDFENNKINTTIWKYLNEAEAAIKDNSKVLFSFDKPILDLIVPISITDEFFLGKMTSKEINENTRAEVLNKLASLSILTIGETIKLIQELTDNLAKRILNEEEKELTILQKGTLNKISKN